jgi:hypothetical protein
MPHTTSAVADGFSTPLSRPLDSLSGCNSLRTGTERLLYLNSISSLLAILDAINGLPVGTHEQVYWQVLHQANCPKLSF